MIREKTTRSNGYVGICIVEDVITYQRNLAVAFYDCKNSHDKVHHDRMLCVYKSIGVPQAVVSLLKEWISRWKTTLEI